MRKFLTGGLLLSLALLTGPALPGQDASDLDAIVADEVLATLTQLWDAVSDGDLNRYAGYLHPDYTVFGEDDVYLSTGKDAAVESMRDFLRRSENIRTQMHQPRVTVRGNVAWVTYYWTESGTVDEEPYSSRGKSTRIFVQDDGPWLCIHGHFTAVP